MKRNTRKRALSRIKKLIAARYGTNLTIAARDIGISYWTLYRTLRGETMVSVEFLQVIGEHFGVTLDQLVANHE